MRDLPKSPIFRVLAAFLVVLLFTAGLRELRSNTSTAPDFSCRESGREVIVHIDTGASGSAIGKVLLDAGVVKSSESYFRVAVGDPRSSQVAPGNHRLTLQNCAAQALEQLLDVKRLSGLINVQEGMWLSEILPQMYRAGFSASDVRSALVNLKKPNGFTSLEGLFFPAQYSFDKDTSALAALSSMVSRAESEMSAAGFFKSGEKFTPQQLLTFASLIQAEGKVQDFTKISQVIRNRLLKGMPLQFDSTVHYVKKSRGNIFLSTQGTLINSPYNTYRKYGLPPGPINSPGLQAMNAALNPEPGNWLYFITVAPSDTRFTDNLEQFNIWKSEYKKNLRSGLFRSKE
ncbi:MAG: hypothetical protein RLZZ222_105 [Actinomycetota bacterium]